MLILEDFSHENELLLRKYDAAVARIGNFAFFCSHKLHKIDNYFILNKHIKNWESIDKEL